MRTKVTMSVQESIFRRYALFGQVSTWKQIAEDCNTSPESIAVQLRNPDVAEVWTSAGHTAYKPSASGLHDLAIRSFSPFDYVELPTVRRVTQR